MMFYTRETLARPPSPLAVAVGLAIFSVFVLSIAWAGDDPLSQKSLDELKAKMESVQTVAPPQKSRAEIEADLVACQKQLEGVIDDDDEL